MLNPLDPLTLILIGLSTFHLIEGSHGDTSTEECNVALNFTAVGLKNLPNGFVNNDFVTHLTLDGNEIEEVSADVFSSVPNLSYLSLANNKLKTLTLKPFSGLIYLKTLILNGNCKKQTVTKYRLSSSEDYDDITYDYVRRQVPYEEITYCSFQFEPESYHLNLTHLFLENNDIKTIYFGYEYLPAVRNFRTLTHLFLSHNPVTMDQKTMSRLSRFAPALTHLYLQNCGIAKLNVSLLPTVTSLYLDGNGIGSICSNDFCASDSLDLNDARTLTALSLSHNEISDIDFNAFSYTKNLLSLDLSHNRISEIREGTFDGLNSLHSLSLEYNKLVSLSAVYVFRDLNKLEILYLGGNDLSDIGRGFFSNLTTLRQLWLNDSRISGIDPEMFSYLTDLEVLSLAGNQLMRIPAGSLTSLGSLITLNLDKNEFTNTKDISLDNKPNLLSVSLKDNPLTIISAKSIINVGSENLTISLGNSPLM